MKFTVGTLVSRTSDYEEMLTSFHRCGFNQSNTEFLKIDNTRGNDHDAFSGLRHILDRAKGQYVILCHQDIRLITQGFDYLSNVLEDLSNIDSSWAVAGNAGVTTHDTYAIRITDPHGTNVYRGSLPCKVVSLDENFLVVRSESFFTSFHWFRRLSFLRNGFMSYCTASRQICLGCRLSSGAFKRWKN